MLALLRRFVSPSWLVALAILSAAGCMLGAKLWLIRDLGSDVPFMDQWDAQARLLYIPYAEHRLAPQNFYWPHNEHRVLFTRLLNFALTYGNRQWDPLLEMCVNALIHVGLAAALLAFARRHARGAVWGVVALVTVAMLALPFAWENTLAGFQSQFYLIEWAALGMLWLCLPAQPLSARWWAGTLVGALSLGAMSSGFMAAAAALAVLVARAWCERRWTWRDTVAAMLWLAICVAGMKLINPVPGHLPLRAGTAGEWLLSLCTAMAWPASDWPWCALLVQLPAIACAFSCWRNRRLAPADAVLLGLALWSWLQIAALAFARGANCGVLSPRYCDLYAIGVAVNAIALARMWRGRAALAWSLVAAGWLVALTLGLRTQTDNAYRFYLDGFSAVKAGERRHMRDFVRTGDPAVIRNAPGNEWPHSTLEVMTEVLSHPGMRALLPVSIRPELALRPAAGSVGFARTAPVKLEGQPDHAVWSATSGPAKFVSEPLPANCLPVLRFVFAGSADLPPDSLRLETADGCRVTPQVQRIAGHRWQTAHLALPTGSEVRVVVELPAGRHWFAFAEPVEMGRGSWYAHHLRKYSVGIFGLSAGLLALALAALAGREPPAEGWHRLTQSLRALSQRCATWSVTIIAWGKAKATLKPRTLGAAIARSAPFLSVLTTRPMRRCLFAGTIATAIAVVLSAKLVLIQSYGSDVPYMDQWDAEAWKLFIPYTEGRWGAGAFFQPHNEHRILFTRLINFGLTAANRQWDPLLEMSFNALLHTSVAAMILLYARKVARGLAYAFVLAVVVALFALPLAWENTLAGFQSQFYLLQGCGFAAIWLMLSHRPLTRFWWGGFLFALVGLGTMSSGFLCAPPCMAVLAYHSWRNRRWTWRESVAIALLAGYSLIGAQLIHHVPYHDQFRASSVGQYMQSLQQALSWPATSGLLATAILQAPWMLYFVNHCRKRTLNPVDAVLVGLGLWCWLQLTALAYGRGGGLMGSLRYADLFATTVVVNALAAARLWRQRMPAAAWLATLWLAVLGSAVYVNYTAVAAELRLRPEAKRNERELIRAFVRSGDPATLSAAPIASLPHTHPQSLIWYLSHPGIRSLLPVSIRPNLGLVAAAGTQGFACTEPAPLPGQPDRVAWNATHGPAKFISEPLPANSLPVLRFTFSGAPELPPNVLWLEAADGRRTPLQVQQIVGHRWQTAHLLQPAGSTVRVVVELPAGVGGFAFANPTEMGRGSWYAYNLRKHASWVLRVSAVLLLAALSALTWRQPPAVSRLRA
ncbi:MAG: hypothetical protein HZA31_07910 [Opitutae bacterium]|nr:hypothetical protein [Opitutae bacterium]